MKIISVRWGDLEYHLTTYSVLAGNLVDMGKLAFAPATPEVLKLAAHLRSSHELFADVFHGVFRWVFTILLEHAYYERCTVERSFPHQAVIRNQLLVKALKDVLPTCACRTESDAEDYISSETERLWALVVFNSGPSATGSGATLSRCPVAHVSCLLCKFSGAFFMPPSWKVLK